jgi:hypothetical protein
MPGEPKIKAAVILGFADNVNQWRGCFGPSPALPESSTLAILDV